MKSTQIIIGLIIVGVVGVIGFNLLSQQETEQSDSQNSPAINLGTQNSKTGEAQNPQATEKYVTYSPEAIAEATKDGGKALLFFHANWCPTCRAAEKNILSNSNDLPENLTVIKTDYEEYSDLKKKYNVTYQHTFVQVDADGNMITSWNGGDTKTILQRLK